MSTLDERAGGTIEQQRAALNAILDRQRRAFTSDGPPGADVRRNRIDRLMALVLDNTDAFVDAVAADFGTRSKAATLFTEVIGMVSVIEHTRSHVPQWMRPTKLTPVARLCGLRAEVQPAPLGVVGIIGPWNFPLNLVVLHLVRRGPHLDRRSQYLVLLKQRHHQPSTACARAQR